MQSWHRLESCAGAERVGKVYMASSDPQDYLREQERLRQILEPDEQVLWEGKPERIAHVWSNAPAAAFGAVWVAMIGGGIYGVMTVGDKRPSVWFWPCAAVFVAIGLLLAAAPLGAVLGWRNFAQALTSRRLLTHFPALGRTFFSAVYLDSVTLMDLKIGLVDRWRGTGAIGAVVSSADRAVRPESVNEPGVTLRGVRDPKEVLRMIDRARQGAHDRNERGVRGRPEAGDHGEGCLREMLQPDERVLWEGKPDRGAYALEHVPLTVFGAFGSLVVGVVVYMFAVQAKSHYVGLAFWLMIAPLLVTSLYLMLGTPLRAAYGWRNIAYAVTTRRMFMIHGGLGKMFYSAVYLDSISTLDLQRGVVDALRGTWTIRAETASDDAARTRRSHRRVRSGIEFSGVPNPNELLRVIAQSRDQAQGRLE